MSHFQPFSDGLPAAYQLRYHTGLSTHGKRPYFRSADTKELVGSVLSEVAERNRYHVLDYTVADNGLYLLLSLRPEHSVSGAVKSIRGNIATAMKRRVWSRGIFARSVGTVNARTIAEYVASQFEHHGLSRTEFEPVGYEGDIAQMCDLRKSAHAVFEMNHHFVFVVEGREYLFERDVAACLVKSMLQTSCQQDIIVWRIEILPDHAHLVLGLKPSHTPAQVACRLLTDSSLSLNERWGGGLNRSGTVWKQSYYVGSAGSATTAQVRAWLRKMGIDRAPPNTKVVDAVRSRFVG